MYEQIVVQIACFQVGGGACSGKRANGCNGFGKVMEERIQVNEDSVWYGAPALRNNPDTLKYLPEIRRLILEEQIGKAERLLKFAMSGCPESMRPYQTFGDINFRFEGIGEVTEYERSLDLEQALYRQRFTAEGVRYDREMFISHPDQVMCMRFSCILHAKARLCTKVRYGERIEAVDLQPGEARACFC